MARSAQSRSKGWVPEGLLWGLAFLSTAKRSVNSEPLSVRAVVGQDGVDRDREAVEKAREKTRSGGGAAIGEDFEIDKAGGAIDRDIGVAPLARQRRQVFDVDMDKPGRRIGLEGGRRRLLRGHPGGQAVALQAAVHAAARQLRVDAAPHRLDDVVERQRQAAAQLEDQGFFPIADRGGQPMRPGRAIGDLWRAFQRATVRGWMPSSRANTALEAVLCWI